MISGIITATLLLAFIGIGVWAWSPRNRAGFADAARLPLDEDTPRAPAAPATKTRREERS